MNLTLFRSRSIFLFAIIASCLSSCKHYPYQKTGHSKTLHIAVTHDPLSLDPRRVHLSRDISICQFIYEGLMRSSGSHLNTALADKIHISKCKTIYTFYLKKSFWSNGDPLTAYDFEDSIKDVFSRPISSPSTGLLNFIKNAQAILKQQCPVDHLGIRALDASTLEIQLEQPCEYFLNLLALPVFFPVHRTLRDASSEDSSSELFISNGAMIVQKFQPQHQLILTKNPYYNQNAETNLDSIIFHVTPDRYTAIKLFKNNYLDWLGSPWGSSLSLEEQTYISNDQKHVYPILATTSLICNIKNEALKNIYLRKAINLAIDRNKLIPLIAPGQIASHFLPPYLSAIDQEEPFTSHQERIALARDYLQLARKTLSEKELSKLSIIYPLDSSDLKDIVQEIQKQLKETLDLSINIYGLEYHCFISRRNNLEFALATGKWIAEYDHPLSFLSIFSPVHESSHPALAQWNNSRYNELIKDLYSLSNKEKQKEAELLLADQLPIISLYHFNYMYALHPRVKYQNNNMLKHANLNEIQLVQ